MPKYCGKIGFVTTTESTTNPGVWFETATERKVYGDVIKHSLRLQEPDKVNSDLMLSNTFSIVADSFIKENIGYMKYISYMGHNWLITSFDVAYPRITVSIGGKYNGVTVTTT